MLLAPLVEIFCDVDDFCKNYANKLVNKILPGKGKRHRPVRMAASEMITIMILFHLSHYRTFKDFYQTCILSHGKNDFPQVLSYPRFVSLIPRLLGHLTAYVLSKTGEATGLYYIDSTKLVVCHNRRIHGHRVFKGIAQRGHCSVGYFFGFKLHLVINHQGEIVSFCVTKGHVDDRKVLEKLTFGLRGWCAGDKGYLDKKREERLSQRGLQLITKVRKNMKAKVLTAFEKFFLSQRSVVESVIEQLKSVCHIEHSRHRSPVNFLVNLLGGLAGYCLKQRKPSARIRKANNLHEKSLLIQN